MFPVLWARLPSEICVALPKGLNIASSDTVQRCQAHSKLFTQKTPQFMNETFLLLEESLDGVAERLVGCVAVGLGLGLARRSGT